MASQAEIGVQAPRYASARVRVGPFRKGMRGNAIPIVEKLSVPQKMHNVE